MTKAASSELKESRYKPKTSCIKRFNHNPHSSIFDVTQTQVIKGKFSRVFHGTIMNGVSLTECAILQYK